MKNITIVCLALILGCSTYHKREQSEEKIIPVRTAIKSFKELVEKIKVFQKGKKGLPTRATSGNLLDNSPTLLFKNDLDNSIRNPQGELQKAVRELSGLSGQEKALEAGEGIDEITRLNNEILKRINAKFSMVDAMANYEKIVGRSEQPNIQEFIYDTLYGRPFTFEGKPMELPSTLTKGSLDSAHWQFFKDYAKLLRSIEYDAIRFGSYILDGVKSVLSPDRAPLTDSSRKILEKKLKAMEDSFRELHNFLVVSSPKSVRKYFPEPEIDHEFFEDYIKQQREGAKP